MRPRYGVLAVTRAFYQPSLVRSQATYARTVRGTPEVYGYSRLHERATEDH